MKEGFRGERRGSFGRAVGEEAGPEGLCRARWESIQMDGCGVAWELREQNQE